MIAIIIVVALVFIVVYLRAIYIKLETIAEFIEQKK